MPNHSTITQHGSERLSVEHTLILQLLARFATEDCGLRIVALEHERTEQRACRGAVCIAH